MVIIGEKINASRKSIKNAILEKDASEIKKQISNQDEAGAAYIDLNAGTGSGDEQREIDDMKWLIDIALDTTEKKLGIDSADPKIIKTAAEYLDNRRPWLINSIKKEKHIMDELLPLAAQHNVPLIALAMGESGIPETTDDRLKVCKAIADEADKANVPIENLYFDPLVMPLSSDHAHGMTTLNTISGIKNTLPGAKTTMGLSNVSFGLVKRSRVNEAFLIAAITHGLDSAICDPMRREVREAILLGNLVAGRDKFCRRFVRAVRKGNFGQTEQK